MPVQPTYPGVYIEEVSSGARTITGVSTSVAAFVGYLTRGPINEPVRVFNFGDFQRAYGGLHRDSEVSYAVQQFFRNGGNEAWVIRTASGPVAAASVLMGDGSGSTALELEAVHPGDWGNRLRVTVDYPVPDSGDVFGLTVQLFAEQNGEMVPVTTESFPNLAVTATSPRYVQDVINDAFSGSALVRVRAVGNQRPALTGTRSGDLSSLGRLSSDTPALSVDVNGSTHEARLPLRVESLRHVGLQWKSSGSGANEYYVVRANDGDPALIEPSDVLAGGGDLDQGTVGSLAEAEWDWADNDSLGFQTVYVRLGDNADPNDTPTDFVQLRRPPASASEARAALEAGIRGADPADPIFANATVSLITETNGSPPSQVLRVLAGPGASPDSVIEFSQAMSDATTVSDLMLSSSTGVQTNVQAYGVGAGSVANSSQIGGAGGQNGTPPDATALIGDRNAKTGIYALEDVDLFNLLVIPRAGLVSGRPALDPDRGQAMNQAATILTAASRYCRERRAFLLVDPPNDVDELQEMREWIEANANLRHDHAAVYFPRLGVPDPLNEFKLRWLGPSGTMAGLYARTDSERGVWKAPAGTETVLRGVRRLEVKLADTGSGVLNPLGVNALRTFPIYGTVCWGGRTMVGSDERASQWKYVPVRRTALFIEESLYRGLQWVVFEPNDASLWAQIRLSVNGFMQRLFRQGAFQGTSPRDAYFVKCDAETTTQDDIDRGIVNVVVGFAPLKPAEFVILRIQQVAGQDQG